MKTHFCHYFSSIHTVSIFLEYFNTNPKQDIFLLLLIIYCYVTEDHKVSGQNDNFVIQDCVKVSAGCFISDLIAVSFVYWGWRIYFLEDFFTHMFIALMFFDPYLYVVFHLPQSHHMDWIAHGIVVSVKSYFLYGKLLTEP